MRTFLVLLVAIAAIGCGSKGGTSGDGGVTGGCQPLPADDGSLLGWDDDGVHQCADIVVSDRSIGTDLDFIEIVADNSTNKLGVLITVSVLPPPPLGGTYMCNADGGPRNIFMYSNGTTMYAPTSCTVTFTNPGAPGVHATGTFSATVSPPAGGSKSITNGFFDAALFFPGD